MKDITISPIERFKVVLIYLIASIFLFTTASEAYNFIKFNIDVRITYIVVFVLLIFVFLVRILRTKIDFIALMLVARIFIFIITLLLFSNSIDMMPRFLAVVVAFLSYSIFFNLQLNDNDFMTFIKFVFLVVSIQTISAAFNAMNLGVILNHIKVYIRIPFGGSNYISSFLIMLLPFIWFNVDKKIHKYGLSFIGLLAIILTRSNTGFIMLLLFTTMVGIKMKGRKKTLKILVLIIAIILAVFTIYSINSEFFDRYLNVFSNLFSGNESNSIVIAFNGRIQLYKTAIDLISENFLFGLGVNYVENLGALAHNVVLESLLQAGIFNMLILLLVFTIIFRRTKRFPDNNLCLAMNVSLIIVLVNGMIEPNLFAFNFDFFFWGIVGYCMKRYSYNRKIGKRDIALK